MAVPGASKVGGQHGTRKGNQPGLFPDGQLQGGNVAVAHQDFGTSPDDAVVDPVQEPHAP